MMKNYTTDVINLNSYDFSESDRIIVMYSKEKGLIRGIAKGCKKTKSKLGATMQALVANKIIMNEGRNLDIISQADALNSFKNIKTDFNKLSLSMYCAEIVSNFGIEEDANSKEIYSLLYSTLNLISSAKNNIELFLIIIKFQLKIMDLFGFQVSLENCTNCSKKYDLFKTLKFSIATGGVICPDCYEHITNLHGNIVSIHYKIIEFLLALSNAKMEEETPYDKLVTEKICIVCFNLLKDYIQYRSAKKFKTTNVLEYVS